MSEREKMVGKSKRREKSKGGKNRKTGKIERREKLYGIKQIFLKMAVGIFFGTTTGIQILISRPYFFAGCTAISRILGYLTVQTFRFIR